MTLHDVVSKSFILQISFRLRRWIVEYGAPTRIWQISYWPFISAPGARVSGRVVGKHSLKRL